MPQKTDYSEFLNQARNDNNFDYLDEKYNISEETQKHCGIGFVKEWKSPLNDESDTTPPMPCCIIPRGRYNYLAINTTSLGFEKKEVGETDFFNCKRALKNPTPFIVMDEIAAMSIIEVGGEALALCDRMKIVELLKLLQKEYSGKEQCFIFMLNDTAEGQKIQDTISKAIDKEYTDINYITAKIDRKTYHLGKNETINEILKRDKNTLEFMVETYQVEARSKIKNGTQDEIPKPSSGTDVTDWLRNTDRPPETLIKTGFDRLDEALKGGLTAGLHFVGAAPGTGKTALCLQMADQMAQMGTEVLFFSLEMNKYELGARSVSRHTFLNNGLKKTKRNSGKMSYIAKTALEVRNSGFYPEYTKKEMDAIYAAINDYEQYATHINFYERNLIYKKSDPVETMIAAIDKFAKRQKNL